MPTIKLEILTEDKELVTICQLYWEIDEEFNFVHEVAELTELAKLDKKKLPTIVKEVCNACISEWECEDCGKLYIFSSRSDLTSNRKYLLSLADQKVSYVCGDCKKIRWEKENQERRKQEEGAKRAREILDQQKRLEIREVYDLSKHTPIDVQSLTFIDIIYLMALMRAGEYENLSKIMPLAIFDNPLSPTEDCITEIIITPRENHFFDD